MQVYDRVLAHGGQSTLVVLTLGVLIAIGIELILKIARSRIIDRAVYEIDLEFAHEVFAKLMRIRLDQFPGGVGSLAAQVRGFEPVRQFIVSLTLFLVADAPFALFFLAMIYLLGGPIVAAGPALTLVVAVLGGLAFRRAVIRHSTLENLVGNRRQGVLVEAIQGLETLKSTGGVGRMMRRWNELSHQTAHETTELRHINELTTYFAGTMQQLSYVGLVASGAYLATTSNSMTSGSIVACSIISGRVLGAIASLPGLLVQWAQSRAALEGLEKLFALEEDNHRLDAPLAPAHLAGSYELREIEFSYPDQVSPLALHSLKIAAGEKVGILGAVGSGKSTLLKLLAGLAKPHRGIVLLDGLDLQHIAADRRSEGIGYLPQQTRLFSGTLRENLAIGLHDVGEQRLVEACRRTGLLDLISSRPSGLDTRISEGGEGLSGGQKRLVALTRTMLAQPDVWLLDEPTEGMDEGTELGCLKAIQAAVGPGQTLVLVTHNARVLALVDRLIILTPRGVAMDGPREAVIQAIRDAASATAAAAS
jgi:ATP-binding cassette subfamily C protein LapB